VSEKIKYIVKCTFCENDYTVEIEDGEDFSCPTCGGAGNRERAYRVMSALESAEIEALKAELEKHKKKALSSKKRSVEDIASDETMADDFHFERIDKYESSLQRADAIEDEPEVDAMGIPEISDETREWWRYVFFVLVVILLFVGACSEYEEKKEREEKSSYLRYIDDLEWYYD